MSRQVEFSSSQSAMMDEASFSSNELFTQQAAVVLRGSSSSFLKRRVSQKLRDKLSHLSYEELTNCDAASLVAGFDSPLEITEQDVMDSEAFAKRVGSQWKQVLRRQGYSEYANIVLKLVEEGNFLGGADDNKYDEQPEMALEDKKPEEDDTAMCNVSTIDSALESIHRYQLDCDESGQPLKQIPSLSSIVSNRHSSARKVIKQIDQIMSSIDSDTLRATYGYDWDAINEAVRRNEKRLYTFQRSTDHDEHEYEIVPKSLLDESGANIPQTTPAVRFKDEEHHIKSIDSDFFIGTNQHTASILRRKRKREQLQLNNNNDRIVKARSPSSIGETQWIWQDIIDEIPTLDRQNISRDAIHPSFPSIDGSSNENRSEKKDEMVHSAVICGALKPFALTHLWERTHDEVDSLNILESQKRTMRLASKERTWPRSLQSSDRRSELNYKIGAKKNNSKVKWTEDTLGSHKTQQLNNDGKDDVSRQTEASAPDEQPSEQWLEMDLGGCTVEMANIANGNEKTDEIHQKRIHVFRSLELALRF